MVVSKFTEGAWIPTLVIPVIVAGFVGIHRHYTRVSSAIGIEGAIEVPPIRQAVLVLVGDQPNRGVAEGRRWPSPRPSGPGSSRAVTVAGSAEEAELARQRWSEHGFAVPLVVLDSPLRELSHPIMDYLDRIDDLRHDDVVTVVIPEFVVTHLWENALHNQSALWLKSRLHHRPNTIIVSVPVQID